MIAISVSAKEPVALQHMKVVMRMVGHEFLLQLGDSTSRVLPVEKIDGRYRIQFEHDLEFEPDLLWFSASKVFETNNIDSVYILEVETCEGGEVVYSLEKDPKVKDPLFPCKSRPLPKACYAIYFTVLNEPVFVEEKEEDSSETYLYGVLVLIVISGSVLLLRKKVAAQVDSGLVRIGEYTFDKNRMVLNYAGKEEELTGLEAGLLELLVIHENKTLERDYILNVVWKDDGDYVGRTLDVAISKLRKKLAEDPGIKIINIRGVGYRLTVNV